MYVLLTKHKVKMAGYWQSSLFAFLWTENEVEVHKNAKREQGLYPSIFTKLAWSIKDSLYGIKSIEKNMIFVLVYFRALKRKPVRC